MVFRSKIAAVFAGLVAALALSGAVAPQASAGSAFGCIFDASNPWKPVDGRIWTRLQVRCGSDRSLYWHARLTKDINNWPDKTVGSSDGFAHFQAGVTYTWYLSNNRESCPGNGYFFGKLSLQTGSFSTAYTDRSSDVYVYHC